MAAVETRGWGVNWTWAAVRLAENFGNFGNFRGSRSRPSPPNPLLPWDMGEGGFSTRLSQ